MGREHSHQAKRVPCIAVLPQGLEAIGADELSVLGAKEVKPLRRAAAFDADMACLYRLHLQARLPFRLLREMSHFPCREREDLYDGIQQALDWEHWLHPSMSFRVDVTGTAQGLNHSHFTALQVKNAVIDRQRELWGERSSIDLEAPDLNLHLHLHRGEATLSLDGSGGSLHRRGYRAAMGAAPLKENLAAGLIRLCGWDGTTPLVDPLCGSGTLLIEAAAMALQLSPGFRRHFALESWADFDLNRCESERNRAKSRERKNQTLPLIQGFEADPSIAAQARSNVQAAGLEHVVEIKTGSFPNTRTGTWNAGVQSPTANASRRQRSGGLAPTWSLRQGPRVWMGLWAWRQPPTHWSPAHEGAGFRSVALDCHQRTDVLTFSAPERREWCATALEVGWWGPQRAGRPPAG